MIHLDFCSPLKCMLKINASKRSELREEMKGKVQRLAAARRRSARWIMREAIEQQVEREEKRERFRPSAVAAWNDDQAAGQLTTWSRNSVVGSSSLAMAAEAPVKAEYSHASWAAAFRAWTAICAKRARRSSGSPPDG